MADSLYIGLPLSRNSGVCANGGAAVHAWFSLSCGIGRIHGCFFAVVSETFSCRPMFRPQTFRRG